jgi:DNA-binding CsgD family transcriptional regulator
MQPRTTVSETFSPLPSPDSNPFPIECLFLGLSTLKIGIAVVDRRLRFRSINRVLADMNNLAPEAHSGRPLHEILGPLTAKVVSSLEQVFTTKQPLPNVALSGKLPSRPEPVTFLQFLFPLLGSCGRVVEVGAFVIEKKSSSVLSRANGETTHNTFGILPSNAPLHCGFLSSCPTGLNLTGRELDVLRLLGTGNSNKEISSVLGISVKTVETYRSRLMLKVHAPSLTHLVHYAIRHQIVALLG